MNLKIKTITLENFKGIKDATYDFSTCNTVSGANGLGKSTIACAYYWLMADCDSELHSNPAVFNIENSESSPVVEIICDIDGKQVALSRTTKRTVKKAKREGDADSVSFSNTYSVNAVEYGLRDFKSKLEEYGITDKFLTLSHADSFLGEKKDEMRKVLFGMISNITDLDIARTLTGVDEATKLLEDYTFNEVAAMQNNSLRKVKEIYGKDGELLRSKIEGLEMSKVDLDFAELELQKNGLQERLEKNQDAQRVGNLIEEELNKLREQNMKVQFELSGIKQKEEAEERAAEEKILVERTHNDWRRLELESDIKKYQSKIAMCDSNINALETEKNGYADKIKQIKAKVFDENSTFCPACHRVFESDKIAEMKIHFEKDKENQITNLAERINEFDNMIAVRRMERDEIESEIKKAMDDKAEIETALKKPINALDGNMEKPNLYSDKKDKLTAELENIAKQIEIKKAGMPNMAMLKAEELNLHGELRDCEIQLSKADDNCRIDEKIEELRKQQMDFEQNKADAEKILYQLSIIKQAKNVRLTDEINKHFKLVKWKLFDYQKNGEIKDVVVPTVSGKDLGVALNNALVVRAKLDICTGLQNFYNEHYPVFIDNCESLDAENQALLGNDTQIIRLCVSDDKKLTFKEV